MSNVSHLKGAYCHGLLHLIILISGTFLGNEYSDSPRLWRNTRALLKIAAWEEGDTRS